MFNSVITFILTLYVFLVGVLGIYPSQGELQQGVNVDPIPCVFDESIEGYRYLHGERELPFRLKAPESVDENEEYPLIVFLHGSGERGNDNQCHVMRSLLKGVKNNGTPCYILMPQLHSVGNWTDDDIDLALTSLIDEYILKDYPIDESRIYITGDSRGGAGTFDQVIRHEGKYAAAMPLCGYHETFYNGSDVYVKFKDIPMWLGHNLGDPIVSVSNSRGVYETVTAMGGENIKYTEYKTIGHNCWDTFYEESEVWEWLFKQSL